MAFKRTHVEKWAATALPGETIVSYVLTTTFTPGGFGVVAGGAIVVHTNGPDVGDDRRVDLREQLGLDPEKRIDVRKTTNLLVLTNRRLVLATRSARNRPKDIVHAGPAEKARVHWFDHDAGSGTRLRHFIIEFGDGYWRTDRSGVTALGRTIKANNADGFVAALGSRAIEVSEG